MHDCRGVRKGAVSWHGCLNRRSFPRHPAAGKACAGHMRAPGLHDGREGACRWPPQETSLFLPSMLKVPFWLENVKDPHEHA